jgi:hypothetical protein
MPDCHVETYIELAWRSKPGMYRASVIHTTSGRVLYVTWPYVSEQSAIDRARRWIAEEYAKTERFDLFEDLTG